MDFSDLLPNFLDEFLYVKLAFEVYVDLFWSVAAKTLCVEAEADQTTSVSSPELLADGDKIDKDAVQNPAKKAKQDALTEVSSRF